MKTLLILRHAKSSWNHPGLDDHDRPLNKRGAKDAPRMGRLLAELGLKPDVILSSTAARARATAEAVAQESAFTGGIAFQRELYAAEPEAYLRLLAALPGDLECALVVGHNPGLEDLLAALTGEVRALPTAALARVELPVDTWDEIGGVSQARLAGLWIPKELD